jgi:hypothetical protein
MQPRLHALVQHPDNLNNTRIYHAIEDEMHRVGDRRLAAIVAAVANVEAANAGVQLGPLDS